jgi:hypothetical protein
MKQDINEKVLYAAQKFEDANSPDVSRVKKTKIGNMIHYEIEDKDGSYKMVVSPTDTILIAKTPKEHVEVYTDRNSSYSGSMRDEYGYRKLPEKPLYIWRDYILNKFKK